MSMLCNIYNNIIMCIYMYIRLIYSCFAVYTGEETVWPGVEWSSSVRGSMDWCAGGEDLLGDPTLLVAAGMLHGPTQFCTDTCCTPGLEQPNELHTGGIQYQQPAIVTVGGSYNR